MLRWQNLICHIAKLIGVPFIKVDATWFSETVYIGSTIDDMIRDLHVVIQADDNIELAQYGIYLNEVDKIATPPNIRHDVSRQEVQISLLKLMGETEVNFHAGYYAQ